MKSFFTKLTLKTYWPGKYLSALLIIILFSVPNLVSAQKANTDPKLLLTKVGHRSVKDSRFEQGGLYNGFKPEDEILEKRDAYGKHFRNSKGTVTAVISQAKVHYQKDASSPWEDIETTIKPNATGAHTDFTYAVPENIYQLYFSPSLDNGYIMHFATGEMQLGLKGQMRVLDANNNVIKTQARAQATGKVLDNTMTFGNTYAGAYDELKVNSNSIAHDIILTQKPPQLSNGNAATLGFREFVKLPGGWKIVTKAEHGCATCGNTENTAKSFFVIDATGKEVSELLEPVIEEQNERHVPHTGPKGNSIESKHIKTTGEFSIEYADGGAYIETRVSAAWLNDPDRQYPVVIDPTATCYGLNSALYDGTSVSSTTCYCGANYCGDYILWEGGGAYYGWQFFSVSNILSSETVSDVVLHYDVCAVDYPYFYIRNASTYNSSCASIYSYETSGTILSTQDFASNAGTGWYTADLGSSGVSDLQSSLSAGTWGVAFNDYDGTSGYYCECYGYYYGGGYAPYIVVTYSGPNSGACYNTTNGNGTAAGNISPSCSGQTLTLPSTSYAAFKPTAGVTYNFSLSGSGWSGDDMTVYSYNGSAWVPIANGANSLSITPTSAQIANNTSLYVGVYNGTGCPPSWSSNSATLTYQIAPASTPAISENPTTQVCNLSNVVYTASGITVGSFDYFQYQWNGTGPYTTSWITSNPGTWQSNTPGSTLYVEAVANNGGCLATSTPVSVAVDAASSTGSFVSTLYAAGNGNIYTSSGVLTAQSITGYTGSILGWGYGTSSTCSSNNATYPSNPGNATSPWQCCFDIGSDATAVMVEVQNGACAAAQNCYTMTLNTLTAPTSASISPSNLVCPGTSGSITLSYTGGGSNHLPATLNWYAGSCGGTSIGTGNSVVIAAPSATTTYYCAWVDPSGSLSGCASATYTVASLPTVSAASYSICMGSTTTLSPASGGTWVSNNTAVATVSGNTITPVGPGSTTFTFTSSTAPYCTNTTSAVSVAALPVVSVTGPTSFCGTTTTTLSPTSGGTWVSNNTAVATVSGYTVTGTSAGGSTNFTFTSSTSPNCANSTANVTVTGLPTVYGVTGGGTYCLGSSAPVGLSNSQTGVNYQLILNGSTNMGSPVAGTGSAISFPNQTALGTYTVIATTVTNSCSISMSGNAVVTTLSPNVTNSPGGTGATPTGGTLNGTD